MKEKAFEKATEYIDAIASKMGVAAEHVYELMVRQQIVKGIADIIVSTIVLVILSLLVKFIVSVLTKSEFEKITGGGYFASYDRPLNNYAKIRDFGDGIPLALLSVGVIIGIIASVGSIYGGILAVASPEYYAIKEILDAIGGK